MTADVIQARYEQLDSAAARFARSAHESAELHKRITRGVEALAHGGWEGAGAAAFFAEMHGTIDPAMQRLVHALESAHAATLEAKQILLAAEAEAARVFAGGSTMEQHDASDPSNASFSGGDGGGGGGGSWVAEQTNTQDSFFQTARGLAEFVIKGTSFLEGASSYLGKDSTVVAGLLKQIMKGDFAKLTSGANKFNEEIKRVPGMKFLTEDTVVHGLKIPVGGIAVDSLLYFAKGGENGHDYSRGALLSSVATSATLGILGKAIPGVGTALMINDGVQLGGTALNFATAGTAKLLAGPEYDARIEADAKQVKDGLEKMDITRPVHKLYDFAFNGGSLGDAGQSVLDIGRGTVEVVSGFQDQASIIEVEGNKRLHEAVDATNHMISDAHQAVGQTVDHAMQDVTNAASNTARNTFRSIKGLFGG